MKPFPHNESCQQVDAQGQEVIEKKTETQWLIDRTALPALYPTHANTPLFWEYLGRTVATFGFLEEVLARAFFVFTGTREYPSDEIEDTHKAWPSKLTRALTDTLDPLAVSYGEAVRKKQDPSIKDVDDLVQRIRRAAKIRNVLCHGSWGVPDKEGKSLPRFIRNRSNPESFDTRIDIPFLMQVQNEVRDLACDVIDTVTQMGYQFPGSSGPGETIWPHR